MSGFFYAHSNHLPADGALLYGSINRGCHILMFAGPALQALVIVVSSIIGFGGGWTASQWRNGAEIAKLKSENGSLKAANDKCTIDIGSVREGGKQLKDALAAKEREAEAAMLSAKEEANKRLEMARKIKNAPVQEGETQCQSVEREQKEYVEARRNG